jgi:outer membrane protein insertion porin family
MRDAVVDVQEGPTGRFLLSAGLGSDSGVLGGITLEEDNFDAANWPSSWNDIWQGNAFRGAGQRLSILLQAGTKRSFYAISWENPAVGNTEYGVGAVLYSRGMTRNEFDETRTGAAVTVSQHLSKFVRRTLTLGYESIDVNNVSLGAPAVLTGAKGTHSKPFVRVAASVDRRDSRFVPSQGYSAGAEAELSAGDVHAAKLTVQGEKYWTVSEDQGRHKQILGLRARAAVISSFSGDVPVYERLYAGGFSTLRGFAFEGVSPAVKGKQVGGDSMLVGSVEYSVPLTEDDRLRLVPFCDAGYVDEAVGGIVTGWSKLRLSLGVGVRWQAPFLGPAAIEVDLAAPLLKQSSDETQILSFSVGAERRF